MANAPLDYETPTRSRRAFFRWPPDWRRRLLIAGIAAPIVAIVTFQVARLSQARMVYQYRAGGAKAQYMIREYQREVDEYVSAQGHAPVALTDVPSIAERNALDPAYLIDPWGFPYVLTVTNGKPTVMSYGADGKPGGRGLDADITAASAYGSSPLTLGQYIQHARMVPVVLICLGNTGLVAYLCFFANADTRGRRGLLGLLIAIILSSVVSTFIAGIIAVVHAPSGH